MFEKGKNGAGNKEDFIVGEKRFVELKRRLKLMKVSPIEAGIPGI